MRILMVCLGNICRSPLAHGIMRHLAAERGLGWTVESAGTGNWHVGDPPDRRAIAVAKQYGVDISRQRAQHFNATMFDQYDHILVMDRSNYRDVLGFAKTDEHRAKVRLFLGSDEVPDPYYDDGMFEPVYAMVEARCRSLMDTLSANGNRREASRA